jgi:hypothetical protein
MIVWIIAGGWVGLAWLFILALCRAAAQGDAALDEWRWRR